MLMKEIQRKQIGKKTGSKKPAEDEVERRRGKGDYLGRRLSTSSDGEEEECGRSGETSSRFAEKGLVFIDSLVGKEPWSECRRKNTSTSFPSVLSVAAGGGNGSVRTLPLETSL